jgi:hypothetical protein
MKPSRQAVLIVNQSTIFIGQAVQKNVQKKLQRIAVL